MRCHRCRGHGREGVPTESGIVVYGDDARSLVPRHHSNELLDGLANSCGSQHDGGLRIAENRLKAFGVSGQFRCKKRNRDVPAWMAAKKPVTYSRPCGARIATRSPREVTCCSRAPIAWDRVPTWLHVSSTLRPSTEWV